MSELINFILDHEEGFTQTRLASLYADFARDARIDPDNYAANVEDWKKALYHAARAGRLPSNTGAAAVNGIWSPRKKTQPGTSGGARGPNDTLTIQTGEPLLRALEISPWGRPDSLGAVVQDAVNNRELIPVDEYLAEKQSIYERSWISIPTPWQVFSWGMKRIGLFNPVSGEAVKVGRLVCVENLESAASAIQSRFADTNTTPTARIHSVQTFTQEFADDQEAPFTSSDLKILLTYLSRDKPILSYNAAKDTIKFSVSATARPEPITENDTSAAQIKTLLQSLDAALPDLEAKVAELDRTARDAVSKKDTAKARAALRRKKLLATTLEKRRANHAQLEEILLSIDSAHDSAAMMRAMSASAAVLKSLNSEVGGVEGVDRVTDRLREEMEKAEEISDAVAEVGRDGADEEAVDAEFEALERAEREKSEAKERLEREERDAARMRELDELDAKRKLAEERRRADEEHAARERKARDDEAERALTRSIDRLKALHVDGDDRGGVEPTEEKADGARAETVPAP